MSIFTPEPRCVSSEPGMNKFKFSLNQNKSKLKLGIFKKIKVGSAVYIFEFSAKIKHT